MVGAFEAGDPALEQQIAACLDRGDLARAAELIVTHYGPLIIGLLRTRLHSEVEVSDVFSDFAEDLWRGLPTFSFRSTARAWAFTLSRNAAHRYSRSKQRTRARASSSDGLEQLVADVRQTTLVFLRSEVKSRMQQLRERLDPDDQTLLALRVDRNLSWDELAFVLAEASEGDSDAERARAAARTRKRFQRAKARLRELAAEEGLIARDSPPDAGD